MRLIDLDSDKDYVLDGKYSVKRKPQGYWEYTGVVLMNGEKIEYGQCGHCHQLVYKEKYCSNCGYRMRDK